MSIDDEDRKLFREAVGPVRRRRNRREASRPPPPPAVPLQRRRDEDAVLEELAHGPIDFSTVETGEELMWLLPGLQKRILKRLRRGHWAVQDELDLHQMNTKAAGISIRAFIENAVWEGMSCIKIIHGKGLRSGPDGPRLKRLTARLLSRHSDVRAFASAPPTDGGTGAVYVLLGSRR